MKSFVTTFDYQSTSVSFGLNVNAVDGTKLSRLDEAGNINWLEFVLITLGFLTLSVMMIFAVRCILTRKKKYKREKIEKEANAIAYSE